MMSSIFVADPLADALFGKNRQAVLGLLYGHPDEQFYLREIVRAAGRGVGAIQRELQELTAAGIVCRAARGRHVFFQANHACPVFDELRAMVLKTAGVAAVLRGALAPLGEAVQLAFVFGSVAAGSQRQASDLDLLVVGTASFTDVVGALSTAQERLRREINPAVYPPGEFRTKLAAGHHFLKTVLAGAKVFVIGGEHELAKLAEQPLAHSARGDAAGDRRSARRRAARSGRQSGTGPQP